MKTGRLAITKTRTAIARNLRVKFPELQRSELVKLLMKECNVSYSSANRAVGMAERYYPHTFRKVLERGGWGLRMSAKCKECRENEAKG